METVNIFRAASAEDMVDVGGAVGSTRTAMFLHDHAPGQGSRYHYEYEEEWLLVVEGTVVLRTPDGEQTLAPGDVVCFPAGPAGAHQVTNRSDAPARTLMFSGKRSPSVVVYPDSDTVGVFVAGEANDTVFRRSTAVPWAYGWYPARED
jgi:uncharacterized cupin superfamily protein